MSAGRQFKLFTNTFEREVAFQKLKLEQQGSCFLFHGSPFMKWHSIMRTCLQNFSNAQFMTTGAAYGGGVYTAKQVGSACASNVQICMGADQVPSACKHTALMHTACQHKHFDVCFQFSLLPYEQHFISSICFVCDNIIRQLQLIRGHVYHGADTIQIVFCCRQVLVWATAEQHTLWEQLRMQS